MGPTGRLTPAALAKMKYLQACQKESQRLLPVVFGTGRQTQVDMVLGGYHIPSGTKVVRAGMITSVSSKHFTDPESFVPERWLRADPKYNTANSFANLPWGHGPRACIGQRFAKLELYMMAAKAVQRFRLEGVGESINIATGMLNIPDKDVRLRFMER